MEFWPKIRRKAQPEKKPELLLTSEMEFKGDFESIATPEQFLDSVDFDTLNTIFDELTVAAGGEGVVQNTGHRVERNKIHFVTEQPDEDVRFSVLGSAYVESGAIDLLWSQKTSDALRPPSAVKLLATLTHEAAHVRGGYAHEELSEDLKDATGISLTKTKIGLEEVVSTDVGFRGSTITHGLHLNEAITEDISREVLREYLFRTGNGSYLKDRETLKEVGTGSYYQERLILSCLLEVLSGKLELPRDILWKGFVEAYMSGNHEVRELVAEMENTISDSAEVFVLTNELLITRAPEDFITTAYALNMATNYERYSKDQDVEERALEKQREILLNMDFNTAAIKDALGLRQ